MSGTDAVGVLDDPNASRRVVGAVRYNNPLRLARAIDWLMASPELGGPNEQKASVTLRQEATGENGFASLVFVWRPTSQNRNPMDRNAGYLLLTTDKPI